MNKNNNHNNANNNHNNNNNNKNNNLRSFVSTLLPSNAIRKICGEHTVYVCLFFMLFQTFMKLCVLKYNNFIVKYQYFSIL